MAETALHPPPPKSCDTFVALPPATANGCVVFGKNSDRPGNEVQEVVYQAAADHAPGTMLQCTYIEVEQAAHTHAVILSKPSWMWGAEMGANDQGVAIGNEAVWTKVGSVKEGLTERLLGMDLLRLGLERGGDAKESLDVITSLLEKYGQGGPCNEGGNWAYHNSFLIADRTHAWVLETAGKFWAAEKVTEGVRNISNDLTITTKMDLMSVNLVKEATSAGLYSPRDGPFNFAKVFAQSYTDPKLEHHDRFCAGRRMLKRLSKDGTFGLKDMMTILRDEGSGICMVGMTQGSQVSVLPPSVSIVPCCHWFTATPHPGISMFKPFLFGPSPDIGHLTISPDYGDTDPARVKPRFQKTVDRQHELFKAHEALGDLIDRDDPKGQIIVKSVQELEAKCIADTEASLKSLDEHSFSNGSSLFKHMCSKEIDCYKSIRPLKVSL